jgi:hypothetical protein
MSLVVMALPSTYFGYAAVTARSAFCVAESSSFVPFSSLPHVSSLLDLFHSIFLRPRDFPSVGILYGATKQSSEWGQFYTRDTHTSTF